LQLTSATWTSMQGAIPSENIPVCTIW
jgi:hypothetical protein